MEGAGDADHDEDPFAGLVLDESFVRGATRREESAEERTARLRRIEDAHARLAIEREEERRAAAARPASVAGRPGRGGQWRTLVVVGLLLVAVTWAVWGRGGGPGSGVLALDRDTTLHELDPARYPPVSDEIADEPLGLPPVAPRGEGGFAFMALQDDGGPVAYDPCRPIHVVVNDRTAPPGGPEALDRALAMVETATGLRFVVDGSTDERPSGRDREPYQPDAYGERWAPVLIAWTDPVEAPGLAGEVAGLGGSGQVTRPDGRQVYVTGSVELDGPAFAQVLGGPGGDAAATGIIAHELAHVVGLDHVDDTTQLMHPDNRAGIVDYQDGDRRGLAALGAGECFPDV